MAGNVVQEIQIVDGEQFVHCTRCKTTKPINEYHRNRSRRIGVDHYCKKCKNAHRQERRALHPEKYILEKKLKQCQRFNMSEEQYDLIIHNQNNLCAVCKREFITPKQVDHDHRCCPTQVSKKGAKTCGKCNRGMLCGKCNKLLGLADDSAQILQNAIEYLTYWENQ